MYLYIMRERWVIYGCPRPKKSGDCSIRLILDRAGTVRVWGTTSGLGLLAREGPTGQTKLDSEPDGVEINELDIMRIIPCNEKAWEKVR